MRARSIGPSWLRLIDWRTTRGEHYSGAGTPRHIRWAAGAPDCLIVESRRRRFRLVWRLRLPRLRRWEGAW